MITFIDTATDYYKFRWIDFLTYNPLWLRQSMFLLLDNGFCMEGFMSQLGISIMKRLN